MGTAEEMNRVHFQKGLSMPKFLNRYGATAPKRIRPGARLRALAFGVCEARHGLKGIGEALGKVSPATTLQISIVQQAPEDREEFRQ